MSILFGSQISRGISTSVNGGAAICTGIRLLGFGPVGWIAGGALILIGVATLTFGVNDIISGISGKNIIKIWTNISEITYNSWEFGLNLASSLGTIAGNIYMNYADVSGNKNPGRKGKPFSRYSTLDDQGVKQYRFFDSNGQAWYDIDFRHPGNDLRFPHYHGWENGIRTTDHWSIWEFLKWFL